MVDFSQCVDHHRQSCCSGRFSARYRGRHLRLRILESTVRTSGSKVQRPARHFFSMTSPMMRDGGLWHGSKPTMSRATPPTSTKLRISSPILTERRTVIVTAGHGLVSTRTIRSTASPMSCTSPLLPRSPTALRGTKTSMVDLRVTKQTGSTILASSTLAATGSSSMLWTPPLASQSLQHRMDLQLRSHTRCSRRDAPPYERPKLPGLRSSHCLGPDIAHGLHRRHTHRVRLP